MLSFIRIYLGVVFFMYLSLTWWLNGLKKKKKKKLPAVQEIQVWSLGQEDPLEKGMTTHPIFYLEDSTDRGAQQATVHRIA